MLRLRASIYRTGYSVWLFYPATPSDIKLAGIDSTDSVDFAQNVVPGPHAQLPNPSGDRPNYHVRIATCDSSILPTTFELAEVGLFQFARVLNIELKYDRQTGMFLP